MVRDFTKFFTSFEAAQIPHTVWISPFPSAHSLFFLVGISLVNAVVLPHFPPQTFQTSLPALLSAKETDTVSDYLGFMTSDILKA